MAQVQICEWTKLTGQEIKDIGKPVIFIERGLCTKKNIYAKLQTVVAWKHQAESNASATGVLLTQHPLSTCFQNLLQRITQPSEPDFDGAVGRAAEESRMRMFFCGSLLHRRDSTIGYNPMLP